MQIQDVLRGIDIPRNDAEVILSSILNCDRSWLIAHASDQLNPEAWTKWAHALERRRALEPVAYITGRQEFFGRPFIVNEYVMIPRPSTEGLVELVLHTLANKTTDRERETDTDIVAWTQQWSDLHDVQTIVDIGTGSGCIALTLACELPDFQILASDLSSAALTVAEKNATALGVGKRVEFRQGSLLTPFGDLTKPFIVVSNPPYIPLHRPLMKDVTDFEPHMALFGGEVGNELITELISQAKAHQFCRGFFMECHREQTLH